MVGVLRTSADEPVTGVDAPLEIRDGQYPDLLSRGTAVTCRQAAGSRRPRPSAWISVGDGAFYAPNKEG